VRTGQEIAELLHRTRQQRGEELADIARHLRIRPAYLAALEQGQYELIVGRPYLMGFLRSYATHLGLDGEALAEALKTWLDTEAAAPGPEGSKPRATSRRLVAVMAAAALLLVGALYAIGRSTPELASPDPGAERAETLAQVEPAAGETAPPSAAAPAPGGGEAVAPEMAPDPAPAAQAEPSKPPEAEGEEPAVAGTTEATPESATGQSDGESLPFEPPPEPSAEGDAGPADEQPVPEPPPAPTATGPAPAETGSEPPAATASPDAMPAPPAAATGDDAPAPPPVPPAAATSAAPPAAAPTDATAPTIPPESAPTATAAPAAPPEPAPATTVPPAPSAEVRPPEADRPAEPAPAPVPVPPPPQAGRFALHLASVRDPGIVAGEWQRLVKLHPSLAGLEPRPPLTVDVPGRGTFYRVVGGAFATRAEAMAACERVRAKENQYCRVVTP
jgi:cytoskeleton protein RodZ